MMEPKASAVNADSTHWPDRFASDREAAAQEIVNAYYERLVRLAGRRLAGMPPQVADDEGAVISALRSFFSGVRAGQFQTLYEPGDLWRVLATITARKVIRQWRVHTKQTGENNHVMRSHPLDQLLSQEQSPEDEIMLLDECRHRLSLLTDSVLKQIAELRLAGWDNRDIANKLQIHVRSVERKIQLIRTIWLNDVDS